MRRREFITLLGGAAAWPLAARAQQLQRVQHIGILMGVADDAETKGWLVTFNQRLEQLGMHPDAVFAFSSIAVAALQRESRTVPIVFTAISDPVGSGFAQSLARPGGNATGFTNFVPTMAAKWLEVLKEIAPQVQHAALLFNPETAPYVSEYYRGPFSGGAWVRCTGERGHSAPNGGYRTGNGRTRPRAGRRPSPAAGQLLLCASEHDFRARRPPPAPCRVPVPIHGARRRLSFVWCRFG